MITAIFKIYITVFIVVICCLSAGCAIQKTPVFLPPASTEEPVAVNISVTAADNTPIPVTPSPSPTSVPEVDSIYTFAWFSDTQHYARQNNGVFERMTDYLASSASELDLRYIIFTGDFVHNRDITAEWTVADRAMRSIDSIPNGVLAGNHDVGTKPEEATYEYYTKYFGEFRYAGRPWYGGSDRDNREHFDLIECGRTQYIFVYLGFQIDDRSIEWAKSVFDSYPDRVGVLCVHGYFETDLTYSEDGVKLKKGLVDTCPNIYLVMCGHRYNSAVITTSIDDNGDNIPDRKVHQMIANYQAIGPSSAPVRTGGDGYIRFLEIDEDKGTIHYYSYSPYLNDYNYFDDAEHRKEKYSFLPENEEGIIEIPWIY